MFNSRNSLVSRGSFFRFRILLILILASQVSVFGQGKQVTGTVYDDSGETLPGVNVIVNGTSIGTITNIDGAYSINVSENANELLFSFVGYIDQTVNVGNKTQLDITLKENVLEMDEVVVVGYGTQKKSDITGSVASISGESLERTPAMRVDEAIQGKAAGVMVLQNSGQPGSAPVIRVRGLATVNGGSPLVVIDGISGGSIGDVNPADIQSIEILKDAASQSIYGSSGGNGVILITTKKGSSGKIRTKFDVYAGIQEAWKTELDIADAQEYAAIYNQYESAKGLEDYFLMENGKYINPITGGALNNTDWVNEIFRTAIVQNYNLSVSGGNKASTFFMGANYNSQEGTVLRTSNDRFTFRLNSEHKIFDKLTIGENFNVSQNTYISQGERNIYGSPLSTAIQMLPHVPIYATDGSGNYAFKDAGLASNIKNPLALIEYNNNESKATSIVGSAFLRANLFKGFTFESRGSLNHGPSQYISFTPVHVIGNADNASATNSVPINTYNRNTNTSFGWQWQNFINYNFTVLEKNNFTVTAGTEASYSKYTFINKTANSVELETEDWKAYTDTTGMRVNQEREVESSGYAYFARLSYDYDGILLLQANYRRDYSSKFGPNNRVGNFPSVSVGLKFSEFDFVKDMDFMDFGKIRVGYGQTGNSDIQPFLYLNSMGIVDMTNYPFGGVINQGAALLTAANPDLKWESVVTQNIGIDLRFLNNRLALTVDAFDRKNKDMLLRKSVPLTVGYFITDAGNELGDGALDTRPLVNYGTLNNRGFEASITYKDQVGKLKYSINANITRAITTIGDIGDPLYAGTSRGLSNVTQTKNDEPISAFYGYKTDGIYQQEEFTWYKDKSRRWYQAAINENGTNVMTGTDLDGNELNMNILDLNAAPGKLRYVDANGDGTISALDIVKIGDPNPDFVYGFGANFEYENFDLNLFFQGSYGNDIYNVMKVNLYTMNNGGLNVSTDLIDSYIPELWDASSKKTPPVFIAEARNTDTGVIRMDGDLSSSDFYIEDGSYLRLKNLQLGYTFPNSSIEKLKIQSLRLYVGAKNLFTITKYSGFDPEVGETTILERGFDQGTYPQSKMYTVGVNLIF